MPPKRKQKFFVRPTFNLNEGLVPTSKALVEFRSMRVSNNTVQSWKPVRAYCPDCMRMVITNVKYKYSKCTCFCCLLGCCCLPFCSMCLVTTRHLCPHCRLVLGMHNPCLRSCF